MKHLIVVLMLAACCLAQGIGSPRRKSTPTPTPSRVSVIDVRHLLQPLDLKLIGDLQDNIEARIALAALQARLGDSADAAQTLASAEASISQLQDDAVKAKEVLKTAEVYVALGQIDHAIELARGSDHPALHLQSIAVLQAMQGDFAGAIKTADLIAVAAERDDAICAIVRVQLSRKHFDDAGETVDLLLNPRTRIDALRETHLALFKVDRGEDGVRVIKKMEALAEEAGSDSCWGFLEIGRAAVDVHDAGMAYTYFERAAEAADKIPDKNLRIITLASIASSWGDAGDSMNHHAALALLNKTIANFSAMNGSSVQPETQRAIVRALAHDGEYMRAAAEMDDNVDLRSDVAEIEAGQGRISEAIALAKAIKDPLPKANALLRIARAIGDRDHFQAMQLLREVLTLTSQSPELEARSVQDGIASGARYQDAAMVTMAKLGEYQQALNDAVPIAGMDTFHEIGSIAFAGSNTASVLDMASSIRQKSGDGADYILLGAAEAALDEIPPEKLRHHSESTTAKRSK